MNEEEKRAFFECFLRLERHRRQLRDFISLLSLHGVITNNDGTSIRKSIRTHSDINLEVIKDIPNHCSKDRLLKCLKMNHKLYKKFKNKLCKATSPVLTPQSINPNGARETYMNNFYEVLKAKALKSGELEWTTDFQRWAIQLSCTLQSLPCGSDKRNVADCYFVLLDLQAVIEKQHKADKTQLWKRPVFQAMESILCETSNPSLSRLIFQSRKGTACAQSSEYEETLKYASLVLCDVAMFSSGKQIGSCIFAVVNMYLQYYSYLCKANRLVEANECKKQILHWIDVGYLQFADEDKDVIKTWRRVYLDKKIYCHLGIDILSRDIQGTIISDDDMEKATQCLQEMEALRDGMERLRLLHFFIAHGKLNMCKGYTLAAKGYYEEALKLAYEGKFHSEVAVLKERFFPPCGKPGEENALGRPGEENDELSPPVTSSISEPSEDNEEDSVKSIITQVQKKLNINDDNAYLNVNN
ncbi:uncharacterized protein LOC110464452 [Mizuhopecten yessoensis]|uniref:uncharacterized protein LOC110464452 n=1 Tax=Mizuhopecten yessoensis TaxID=6573 RepID=UPI000B459947|nr:uncharacterized protein LOC110464452 [Mizuhopecten yessoensis]XP_021375346.1 uncharacterized protein LOC110464452 [Mizuhopecten yessoensis]